MYHLGGVRAMTMKRRLIPKPSDHRANPNQSMPAFTVEIVLNDRYKQAPPFTDDDIRRTGLPKDVFGILHDLAYHHEGRDVWDYVKRAQAALRKEK